MKNTVGRALIIALIMFLIFSQYSFALTISGSRNKIEIPFDELLDMPKEAIIEETYKVNVGGELKEVVVKGVSLKYILTERLVPDMVDGDIIPIFEKKVQKFSPISYKDAINNSAKFVIAIYENGDMVAEEGKPFNIYCRNLIHRESSTIYRGVVGLTLNADIKPNQYADTTTFDDFTDKTDFAKNAANYLRKMGYITGIKGNSFGPTQPITRAQISKIANLVLGGEKVEYKGIFKDVAQSDWYANFVAFAAKNGIFMGYRDSTFKPNMGITRQELAVVISRIAIKKSVISEAELRKFSTYRSEFIDSRLISPWAKNEVSWLEQKGAFAGMFSGYFGPNKAANRAEAARMIYVALFR